MGALGIPGYYPGTVKGSLIGLKINGHFVACETACSFQFDVEMLKTAPQNQGRWKEHIPGERSWSMSVNGNLLLSSVGADIKTVLDAVIFGYPVDLEFRTRTEVAPYLIIKGRAYPQSGGIDAPVTGKSTWMVTFQGDGPFTTDFEQFALIINAMPPEAEWPVVVNTTQW